jgi:DNA polymerase-3 subunit epsilon
MESFIDGLPLVAHNACVERACIHDACTYYNIQTSIPYEDIIDTYLLSIFMDSRFGINIKGEGFHSLNVVCQRYGVKVLRHHHACDDAEMCGNLFIAFSKYLSGELTLDETAWKLVTEYSNKEKSHINPFYQAFEARGHTSLSGDVLQKDLSCADPNNPFYDRKVVITGVFTIERQELASKLKLMGADIDTNVSSRTNYLLIGEEPGPSKLRKFDELIALGKDVRKIYQEDLELILAGKCFERYHTEKLVTTKPKVDAPHDRKTTWANLVKKLKQYVEGEDIEFTERELQSEDYRLLTLYYKQQQKVATTKETVLSNLRELDKESEREFKRDILDCFTEGEDLSKELACERMQDVFTKYGLRFKAKICVLTEFGIDFKEYKDNGTKKLHITINKKPQN